MHPILRSWPEFEAADIQYYTEGQCWSLAWQLHVQGDLPLYTIGRKPRGTTFDWDHVVVRLAERYMDIEGMWAKTTIQKRWGAKLHEMETPHNRTHYRSLLFDDCWHPMYRDTQPARTVLVARRVLRAALGWQA